MKRLIVKENQTNFIGAWNIENNELCKSIISFFQNNSNLHFQGVSAGGKNLNSKKRTDISIRPDLLKEEKFSLLKEYINELHKSLKDGQVLVSEIGEIWRWDGFTSNGKQNDSIQAVVEQLKNRRIKELLKEENSWRDVMVRAKERVTELQKRKENINQDLEKLK